MDLSIACKKLYRELELIDPLFGIQFQEKFNENINDKIFFDAIINKNFDIEKIDENNKSILNFINNINMFSWKKGNEFWLERSKKIIKFMSYYSGDAVSIALLRFFCLIDFSKQKYSENLDLSGTAFPGHVIIKNASIRGKLLLENTRFLGVFDAREIELDRELMAVSCQFLGPAWISGSRIRKSVRMEYSVFHDDFDAANCSLMGGIWLRYAEFKGKADFSNCEFDHDSSLGACEYRDEVNFFNSTFKDTVSFEGAVFHRNVSFHKVKFLKKVLIKETIARKNVNDTDCMMSNSLFPVGKYITTNNGILKLMEFFKKK